MKKLVLLLSLIATVSYSNTISTNASDTSEWSDDYSQIKYVSASTIEGLQKTRDADSLYPQIAESDIHDLYIARPLSKHGILGPSGPLGDDDDIHILEEPGDIALLEFGDYFESFYGAFSETGPLGFLGPLTQKSYYNGDIYSSSTIAPHFRALGVLGVLGPLGPLGPTGILGPLGPLGDHGYKVDENGNYLNKYNLIKRETETPFDYSTTRVFDLFEVYNSDYASGNKELDTSFAVKGSLKDKNYDEYVIHSDQNQVVTIVVTPNYKYSIFTLALYKNKTPARPRQLIAESNSQRFINFIQFLAPKDTSYIVRVASPDNSNKYLLSVTGSTEYLNKYNTKGSHIKAFG